MTYGRVPGMFPEKVEKLLKLPAPTVELPNGKKYLASDVMERCKELEPATP